MPRSPRLPSPFAALLLLGLVAACPDEDVTRELGAPCTSGEDCAATSSCLPPSDETPGGFCTWSCLGPEARSCSSASACVAASGGVCLFICADDDDCGLLSGLDDRRWVCRSLATPDGGLASVCTGE